MKGLFNFRLFAFLIVLMTVYFFICDFQIPVKNMKNKAESIAYVDSVKQLDFFDFYEYDQIYYHYFYNDQSFSDSITSNRDTGVVNEGDSLLVMVSKVHPMNNTVKSIYGQSQEPLQVMGR